MKFKTLLALVLGVGYSNVILAESKAIVPLENFYYVNTLYVKQVVEEFTPLGNPNKTCLVYAGKAVTCFDKPVTTNDIEWPDACSSSKNEDGYTKCYRSRDNEVYYIKEK